MPDVRPLPAIARCYYPLQYVLLGLCLVSFGVLFFRVSDRDVWFYVALVVLIVSTAGCLLSDRLLIRTLACPQCGELLPRAKAPAGKHISIQFHCSKCEIIWDADAPGPPKIHYSDPL